MKEYPDEQAKPAPESTTAAQIAADAAKKFGASPEKPGNGLNLDAKTGNDKLPVQPAKAPEIENLAKITGFAAELLDTNEF